MRARNGIVDATAVLLAAFVALLAMIGGLDHGTLGDRRLLVSLAVTLPALVLLWWRRRKPVHIALLLLVPAALTDFVGGAATVAVFTVAVHRPLRVALAVAVAHFLVPVPLSIQYPDPDLRTLGSNTAAAAIFAVVVAWGVAVRSRRELIATLRLRATRAEEEARQRADLLRGLERERIAREMHDVLAHRISLISLHAGALEIRRDLTPAQVVEAGGTIRSSAHQAMEELREILGVLRTSDDDGLRPRQGLEDLGELVEEARKAGTPVALDNRLPQRLPVPAAVDRTAFRLVQEGLTNARKHAPGAPVAVLLDHCADRDELHVRLHNPLPPLPAGPALPGSRTGLVGLAERVDLVGGRFEHGPRQRDAAGGHELAIRFELEAWLPCRG